MPTRKRILQGSRSGGCHDRNTRVVGRTTHYRQSCCALRRAGPQLYYLDVAGFKPRAQSALARLKRIYRPQPVKKTWAKTDGERIARRAAACSRYDRTPRAKFKYQKYEAKRRKVEWLLSYDEWWAIWEASGKWELRGNYGGGYVMSRPGDVGPYSVANVVITPHIENVAERNRLYFNPAADIGNGEWLAREREWAFWDDPRGDFFAEEWQPRLEADIPF